MEEAIAQNIHQHSNKQVVMYSGEQYFIPFFFLNPELKSTLKLWFPSNNVATPLLHFLLHVRNSIWDMVVDTMKKVRRRGIELKGLRYR